MPFISDAASAIKNRFGFHDHSADPARTTPNISKSVSRDNLAQASAFRSVRDCFHNDSEDDDDEGDRCGNGASSSQSFAFIEDPAFWKDHNVQVIIRIRPLSSAEISLHGYGKCVRQESSQMITWTGPPDSRFTFDLVADENVSQEKLFKVAGVPMVDNCMEGYNSCMFAYGQTGSGKTHTMLGDIEGGTRRHSTNCGMTPRVFEYLFTRIQKDKEARRDEKLKFACKCSFLEIYNEQILDLLDPSSINLQLREDVKKGVYVENLKEVEVASARDVMQQLIQGAANRKVAATNMNRASSRSHSVFTCVIESKWESQGVTHHRFARLNLVDLAGSERQKSSGAEGERLKEATNINKSLSTLGLVIMNLVNMSNGKSLHVPYRDSKLTFLLQDSLGGNSKTIIISNISPSSCCSLETLSTLKFAQRAKFIKNNAIINEDASGDVIAMRIQIQQLKKEVSRLQGLASGSVESHDNDILAVSFPGSPGTFKWERHNASFSPLTSVKRMSQKKDYEVALVGAFRREKDKDIALQALAAENQAAMQLAKQREDEIQGLKMRLRFREAGIKRLEAVVSGKISAETHLLKEKEEHLKEIEVLRTQVNRNQEVTRFAMENLRLKEEIRRLKSFYEEGERETVNEQIMVLQNKLLEALDWKLMHESDSSKKANSNVFIEELNEDDLLISNKEPRLPWQTSINEENEFLRMQAIQTQAEMDTLRKKLELCLEEKEKFEREVKDLATKLAEERSFGAKKEGRPEVELPSLPGDVPILNLSDQMELKAMVDAIAAASQREAEAHETAIVLSKENDELRMKLKVLIEDNNKLIELYESASAECNNRAVGERKMAEGGSEIPNSAVVQHRQDNEDEMNKVENLEQQLMGMHEENEKLMSLYERAMQERDELKRMLSSGGEKTLVAKREFDCAEKVVEVDEDPGFDTHHVDRAQDSEKKPTVFEEEKGLIEESGSLDTMMQVDDDAGFESDHGDQSHNFENKPTLFSEEKDSTGESGSLDTLMQDRFSPKPVEVDEFPGFGSHHGDDHNFDEKPTVPEEENDSIQESGSLGSMVQDGLSLTPDSMDMCTEETSEYMLKQESGNLIDVGTTPAMEIELSNPLTEKVSDDLNLARNKLERAEKQLVDSSVAVSQFGSLEKLVMEIGKLSRETDLMEDTIQAKQRLLESLRLHSSEIQERRALIQKKLSALKYSLSSFSSSVAYFEQREARATTRANTSTLFLEQKRKELANLHAKRDEIEASLSKIQHSESELRDNLSCLVSKLDEENRKQENEKVLFAIDNIDKTDLSQKNWHLGGRAATELLKSEEEKTKLQAEVKHCRARLGATIKELEDLKRKSAKLNAAIVVVETETKKSSKYAEETELALRNILQEKNSLLEMRDNGNAEIESMIIEYQQHTFEAELKEAEMKEVEEELQVELRRSEELRKAKAEAAEKTTELLNFCSDNSCSIALEKMEEELRSVRNSVLEAKLLLEGSLNS